MKVNEIEINGKVYRATYIADSNKYYVCDNCDLKSHCVNDKENGIIFELCQRNPFEGYFKEVTQKENINTKFYRFSTGTVFSVSHIKDIIDMGYVEVCPIEPDKYSFSVLLSNKVTIYFRFDTKLIALRERNKFIRFIETYEY